MERRFVLACGDAEIPCKLYEPDYGPVRRCIIGVHGFGGDKDAAVLVSLSEEMGLFGAATVRFDFPAHGENARTDRELTLPNCQDTLMCVARWCREYYPDTDLCIFASGFGAYITLLMLEELEALAGHIRLVVQTPNVIMADSLLAMTQLTREQFYEQGRVTLNAARRFEVSYNFYEDLRHNPAFIAQPVPMLVLHGELDYVVQLEDLLNFRNLNELAKLVVIPGADHQFRSEGAWDMVVDLTRDWFEYEQILLCDWL